MKRRSQVLFFLSLFTLLSIPLSPSAQTSAQRTEWNVPVEPFTAVGNVRYVGAAGVSAFLITTPAGSILLDGGLPETAPLIVKNIEKLGFKIADVKFLLNSHAHYDHAGGLAELQRLSKATLVASAADATAIQAGGPDMPAVKVGRVVKDGDTVELGGTVMTAHLMPGHTKGCTTWTTQVTDSGRSYSVFFHCSTSVVAPLVGNTDYPQIVSDYESTFRKLRSMKADVFLANHGNFFGMQDKLKRVSAGGPNPFVDPGELARFVEQSERSFRSELKAQQSKQ
jgi:metallo-beta-lactamase class B